MRLALGVDLGVEHLVLEERGGLRLQVDVRPVGLDDLVVLVWSFASGPGAAETWSPPGLAELAAEDAIRRPAVSGASGVAVRALTTSAADSVSTSIVSPLSSGGE